MRLYHASSGDQDQFDLFEAFISKEQIKELNEHDSYVARVDYKRGLKDKEIRDNKNPMVQKQRSMIAARKRTLKKELRYWRMQREWRLGMEPKDIMAKFNVSKQTVWRALNYRDMTTH